MGAENQLVAVDFIKSIIEQTAARTAEETEKRVVKAIEERRRKAEKEKAKKEDEAEQLKQRLKKYRAVKGRLAEEMFSPEELDEMEHEYFEELMGKNRSIESRVERMIEDEKVKRVKESFEIWELDTAFRRYEKACEQSGTWEDRRRCRELFMMYMDEKPYSVNEIAEVENISDKTVYKDVKIACEQMAPHYYGY